MLIRAQRPLHDIVALGIVTSIVAAGTMTLAARPMIRWRGWPAFQLPVHKKEMRFAGGMFAAQIASAVVYQGDRILISSFGSPATAGAYALCANLASKPLVAVVAITSFAFPHASGLHAGGEKERVGRPAARIGSRCCSVDHPAASASALAGRGGLSNSGLERMEQLISRSLSGS